MKSEVDRMKISAVKTLEAAGYTYEGGQLWKPPLGNYPGPLMARIDELEAENRRLREALEPFVEALDDCEDGDERDNDHIWERAPAMVITYGHLRRARGVLRERKA